MGNKTSSKTLSEKTLSEKTLRRVFKLNEDIYEGDVSDILEKESIFKVCERMERKNNGNIQKIDFEYEDIYSMKHKNYDTGKNLFFDMLIQAYDAHVPIKIRIEDVRQQILLGMSAIIGNDPEKYRKYFTDNEENVILMVKDYNFVMNSEMNDWTWVVESFANKMKDNIKDKKLIELIQKKYLTSNPCNMVVNNITTMKIFNNYFSYDFTTMCGYPEIELEGCYEDWILLKEMVSCIGKCGMNWWTDPLMTLIDGFIETADQSKKINVKFWNNLIKYSRQSGGNRLTGFLKLLIPINDKKEINWGELINDHSEFLSQSITVDSILSDSTDVCFVWNYLGKQIPMRIKGGNIAYVVNEGRVGLCQYYAILNREKCYESCKNQNCTYLKTKNKHINQEWVNCKTCFKDLNFGICMSCAEMCHKNHELCNQTSEPINKGNFKPNYGPFFCDCYKCEFRIANTKRNY